MVYNIVMFLEVYCQYNCFKTKLYFS